MYDFYTPEGQRKLKKEFDESTGSAWIENRDGLMPALVHRSRYSTIAQVLCMHCHRFFYSPVESYHKGIRYCSYRCRNDASIVRQKQARELERYKTCPCCGRHFKAVRRDTVFCSHACKQRNYRRKKE